MYETTYYRLFPSFSPSFSQGKSGRLMTLQFLDYSGIKPVWRNIPKYVAHDPASLLDSPNLGNFLVFPEYSEADSITSVCPSSELGDDFRNSDFGIRNLPLIQFALEDSRHEAREFMLTYPNIKDYLIDVLEQFVEDSKQTIIGRNLPAEESDYAVMNLLELQLHRVTYL